MEKGWAKTQPFGKRLGQKFTINSEYVRYIIYCKFLAQSASLEPFRKRLCYYRENYAFDKCLNYSISVFNNFEFVEFFQAFFNLYGLAKTGGFRKYAVKYKYK